MNKKYLPLFAVCSLLISCRSITSQDFAMKKTNQNKLPALEAVLDTSNLNNVFSLGGLIGTGANAGTTFNNNSWLQTSAYNASSYTDLRVQDTLTIFDDFVKNDITNPYGEKKGYIVLNLGYRNNIQRYSNLITVPLTIISLGTISLLGFPAASRQEELQLNVEIMNKNKELVGRYSANVEDTEYIAMYWGYTGPNSNIAVSQELSNSVARKITIENLKNGLYEIGRQINADSAIISAKLK